MSAPSPRRMAGPGEAVRTATPPGAAPGAAAPVVTGVGALAPTGLDTETFWRAALEGRCALGPVRRFDGAGYPVRLVGELPRFDPGARVPRRLLPQTDVWTQQGLAAAQAALDDADLDPSTVPEYAFGVVTAASTGGAEFGQREIGNLWHRGPRHVGAYQSIAWFYAATTGQVSIRHGLRGHCETFVAEAAGGLEAVGGAGRLVADGAAAVLCGATDSVLCPYGLVCHLAGGLLSRGDDPRAAYLPFAAAAAGFVPAEGGAMFVVENPAAASRRGARPLGEVAGHAATFDPPPGSGRPPALRRAVETALHRAGLAPEQVDAVFADGMAVPALDRQEARALTAVFGPYGVPVTVPKAGFGRAYCGGSALDVAAALLSIRDGLLPPTPGVRRADPAHRLDLVVGAPRRLPVRAVLVLSRGFGGFNTALVLRAAGAARGAGATTGDASGGA